MDIFDGFCFRIEFIWDETIINILINIFLTFKLMSKISSDFLRKSITEMITTRKQRKFLEAV